MYEEEGQNPVGGKELEFCDLRQKFQLLAAMRDHASKAIRKKNVGLFLTFLGAENYYSTAYDSL